jgi:hypothetical protein
MERLTHLQREFEETTHNLDFPLSIEERYQMNERINAIRAESKKIASRLQTSDLQWFSLRYVKPAFPRISSTCVVFS